ncbi:ZIP family metal transporter [Hazenella coriacea]|uniref:ZIP family zinc transporter n=1 Tax=Hazenella coriacea TaxID=1179467 RepID=A0A4R3L912_9BACL|nr:ZIP family metal transporter [Hazenella coriacea]TCS95580.1 ZIP family zinc transporter [Hazenella coriacea]
MVGEWEAIFYSSLTGLSTVIGSLLVLFFRLNSRQVAFSLGMSAGVMVLVTYFTLLPSAFTYGGWPHLWIGFVIAIVAMLLIHHLPFSKVKDEGESDHQLGRLGIFLVIAIALHNAPEGIAIGMGYQLEAQLGHTLVIAMLVHNLPEGIGLAAPLVVAGKHPLFIFLLSLFSGAILPIGTWLGKYMTDSLDVVAIGLVFAAVSMIWIVCREIGPRALALSQTHTWIGIGSGCLLMYIIHLFH